MEIWKVLRSLYNFKNGAFFLFSISHLGKIWKGFTKPFYQISILFSVLKPRSRQAFFSGPGATIFYLSLFTLIYRVRQSFPESSGFQYSERTIASTETNITSAESPWSQLSFGTLKVGVALPGGCHALLPWKAYFVEFYGRAAGFWLFDFYDLSRS